MANVYESSTTRTVALPPSEAAPRDGARYRVHGIRMNGDFEIGISVPPDDEGTVDDVPPTLHETVAEVAEETLDVDRISAETTEGRWPNLGTVTVSPVDDTAVTLAIEWLPAQPASS